MIRFFWKNIFPYLKLHLVAVVLHTQWITFLPEDFADEVGDSGLEVPCSCYHIPSNELMGRLLQVLFDELHHWLPSPIS